METYSGLVYVENIDETYVRIKTEQGIHMELSGYFSFYVPNYKFHPKYKNRLWDGKIYLYNRKEQKIYKGLIPKIKEFCKEMNYSCIINFNYNTANPNKEFIGSLDLQSKGSKLELRDYQEKAIEFFLEHYRGTLVSPTSSGKSLIVYCLCRYLAEYLPEDKRILILVPTTMLVEQYWHDFEDYSKNDPWEVESNCQKIYSGFSKVLESKIVISTWQSLYKNPTPYFNSIGCVIGDEVHTMKAKEISSVIEKCTKAKYRFGLTGTLDNEKCHELVIQGLFGEVQQYTTTKELIEKNTLSNFSINCLVLKYSEQERKDSRKFKYQDEINFLIGNKKRNEFIAKLVSTIEGNTLILFNRVEDHGIPLFELLTDKCKGKEVFLVHGGISTKEREEIRNYVEAHKDCVIVATTQLFSTGINIKSLKNVIFVAPSKARIRILQSIGRVLRKSAAKTEAKLYDIVDDLTHKKHVNFAVQHFKERIKVYAAENFKYKLINIDKW